MPDDRPAKLKSAYELALERMEAQGIEPPREEALSEDVRAQVAEARRQAQAKLAELEILHRDRLKKLAEPEARAKEEEEYARDRERVEGDRERRIRKLREG